MPTKSNYQKGLLNEYHSLELRFNFIERENRQLKYEYKLLEKRYNTVKYNYESAKEIAAKEERNKYQKQVDEYQKQLNEKDKEIAKLKSLLNTDSTNSGIPTSKTPINKNKTIPNNRKKSNKKIGGQEGHKKYKLKKFKEEEINEVEYIKLDKCPHCDGKLIDTKETIDKDVTDYKLVVIKKRVKFIKYKCSCCGKEVHEKIPNDLKEENQYGPNVKALTLELLNEGVVSINRVRRIIKGFTNDEIDLSEGYIAKIQKNVAKQLEFFNNELKLKLLKRKLLYWDDTVIFVNKKRACLRFYGDEKLAYYVAHEKKDKEGLDNDNILNTLDKETTVMHDHNKVNYNKEYSFNNIECNTHLQRDLQKVIDNLDATWAKELKKLISDGIKQRKDFIENKIDYNEEFSKNFLNKFDDIMLDAMQENKEHGAVYYADTEKILILRLLDYKENYFAWTIDFGLPTTNNLSERSLRGSKTKLKISGQFQNIRRASDYANIKSYIETCYRNNVNPFEALFRLSLGVPFSINEILSEEK